LDKPKKSNVIRLADRGRPYRPSRALSDTVSLDDSYESFRDPSPDEGPNVPAAIGADDSLVQLPYAMPGVTSIQGEPMDRRHFGTIDDILAARVIGDRVMVTLTLKTHDSRSKPVVRPPDSWFLSLTCMIRREKPRWAISMGIREVYQEEWMPEAYITLVTHAVVNMGTPLDHRIKNEDRLCLVSPSGLSLEAGPDMLGLISRPT
jgi:hypothetical protein